MFRHKNHPQKITYWLKIPGFVDTNAAAKSPDVTLKIFSFVATKMGSKRSRLTTPSVVLIRQSAHTNVI